MQRFALIGAGFIGSVHAQSLAAHPDVDFRFVYDVDFGRAEALAARHGARAARTIADAFDPAQVDAVFIASSTDTHAENLRRAADAGLAALVEKPIDLDLARAAETVAYVERAGIPVMVDFNRRFDRDHAELKRLVDEGEVGEVALVQLTSRGPALPPLDYLKVSGGQMRDQTVHFFDLARWISGLDPVEVFVAGSALADPRVAEIGDVDTSAATLRLSSGALVQIDSVRHTGYGYDERIEVLGSAGMAESGRMRAGGVTRFRGAHATSDGLHAGWFERVQPTYAAALGAFVSALETSGPMPATLRDGLAAQAVAEAAARSLVTGRAEPIDLAL
ncbi:Gfo/Idh/MocA family oxidoreductase [Microbacterium oryzae]|uniref:Gfo/Idh/MocA family protein n=1 Tax=Microbacterium oryzae TaxID=743009 RepID=UPI0025AFB19C|nr:Gfo/Idh/MocA family oxidoreductase [Microbacterium oryzae]MDN3310265.1 Gfo/Idh/MocA family oxidoreductase [Microbacterium oryzae]